MFYCDLGSLGKLEGQRPHVVNVVAMSLAPWFRTPAEALSFKGHPITQGLETAERIPKTEEGL